MSSSTATPTTMKELTQEVLQANKDHQYALKVYTEKLEAELEAVDKLLAAAEAPDDEPGVDVGGHLELTGAIKAFGPIPPEIAPGDHPFAEDAVKRRQYLQYTTIRPMKSSDLDALADAVRSENRRIYALEAQRRGQQPFVALDDHPQSFFERNKEGINWERIAQKVSTAGSAGVSRTALECEIRWLGERHPDFDRSPWPRSEIAKVKELLGNAKEGEVDWVDIAAKLGTGRTPIDCMRHAITRKQHVWTPESDRRLLEMVKIYGTENWILVARQVSEDATAAQCQNRYQRTLDPSLRRGPWTAEEDEKLKRAVEVFGRSWMDICMFVSTRSNEQCRDRWQEHLNPNASRGRWTEDEDQALLAAYEQHGEKWKEVSLRVGSGRTDNMCRHRYILLMKRKAKETTSSSPALQDSGVSTPEPVADSSQPRQHARTQTAPHGLSDSGAETPSIEVDTPAPRRPKPKPRARAKRAQVVDATEVIASTTLQDEATNAQTSQATSENVDANARSSTPAPPRTGQVSEETVLLVPAPEPAQVLGPPKRQRGRPQKGRSQQPRSESEAPSEPPAKKRRTRQSPAPQEPAGDSAEQVQGGKGEDSSEQPVDDRGPVSQEASEDMNDPQLQSQESAVPQPKSSRGRRKRVEPPPRPAPTRQSARLRNPRG